MNEEAKEPESGITRWRWSGLLLVWLAVALPFLLLYGTSRRVILNEVRNHAMGVAIATAFQLDPALLAQVRGPDDVDTEAYRTIQGQLNQISIYNPDIRYMYTMRRVSEPFKGAATYEYLVDGPPRDFNGNGVIDKDEQSEKPGTNYDASGLPELLQAWERPSADWDVTPDPPYPDLLSGYAPVRDGDNRTVAIVGVDVTAATLASKMLAVKVAMFLVWLVLNILITLVIMLYYQQRDAYDRIKELNGEMENRNMMLRNANEVMARNNERYERELRLAQTVQEGFLPKQFPRADKIIFDKYYLTCAILGGDLFDVFDIDDDHVGLFMADVAGHGVSAALISGLLKMAISSVREQQSGGSIYADLTRPDAVVRTLNDMLAKEMPENEFITLIYAVINVTESQMRFASAGHPWPVRYQARFKEHQVCRGQSGLAMGIKSGQRYPAVTVGLDSGDRILFYTDGLTEAMNAGGEEFGEERLCKLIDAHGGLPAAGLLEAIRAAVDEHRGGYEVSDDFSMLVAEIR